MNPQELVADASQLISLPEVALRVVQVADDPKSSAEDIGRVISQDPALTARILKIANSPLYTGSSTVDTVSRAITVLGAKQVRDLSIGVSASEQLENLPNELVSMEIFWAHSIYCGVIAQLLAKKSAIPRTEAMFIAGLLHDIGQLLMFNKLPGLSREALELSMDGPDDLSMAEVERSIFGFDHTMVGGELARTWRLPGMLGACMEFHHRPEDAEEFRAEVAMIHIANSIAILAELESTNEIDAPPIHPDAWTTAGLSKEAIPEAVEQSLERFNEVKSFFSN